MNICTAPTEEQKQRRAEAERVKREMIQQAHDRNVIALCRHALQCQDPNSHGQTKVYTNAGHGYSVKWCGQVVFATVGLGPITTVKRLSCWIHELETMADLAKQQRLQTYRHRLKYAHETRMIEDAYRTC